jgi:hypothetical protein
MSSLMRNWQGGVDEGKGPEGWSSEEESSKKKSRKCSQPREHQGRNWRQQAAHLKERNGYQDRYNRTHNPRPPSERFHASKPSYAKREDFKQAVKVAAAQMAAKRYFNPKFNPRQALIAVNSTVPREITSRHLLLRLKKILPRT